MTDSVFVCRHVCRGERVSYLGNLEGYWIASCSCGKFFRGDDLDMMAELVSIDFLAEDKVVLEILQMLPVDCAAVRDGTDGWTFSYLEGTNAWTENSEFPDGTLITPSYEEYFVEISGATPYVLQHEDGIIATARYNTGLAYLPVFSSFDRVIEEIEGIDMAMAPELLRYEILASLPSRISFANVDDGRWRHKAIVPTRYLEGWLKPGSV